MRAMLRATNPEAARALEADERAAAERKKYAANTRGIIAIAVGLIALFAFAALHH
jgi:hypothetical protein